MTSDRANKLEKLKEKLAQREQEAAKLRARLNAEITKKRNGQIMAWGEAIEAAYIKADDSQKSHIEAMILGALNGEGAKVKMWHRRATEGFARLKDKEIPTEPQQPITPKEKAQPVQPVQPVQAQSAPVASHLVEQKTENAETSKNTFSASQPTNVTSSNNTTVENRRGPKSVGIVTPRINQMPTKSPF